MKKLFTLLMLGAGMLSAHAQYQLANAGFEQWENVANQQSNKKTGEEPKYWSSFIDMKVKNTFTFGGAIQKQLEMSDQTRPNSDGRYSAYIYGAKVLSVATAQGNLTNGCVYGGSLSPSDASGNYNFTNTDRDDQSMKFSGRPDAVKVWIKASTAQNFNISVLLHEQGYYQDPFANASKCVKLIAHAKETPASNNGVWTEYNVPFVYDDKTPNARPYYALVTFATSGTPGVASENDKMWVDDVVMVYNSELATATYDGSNITFNGTSATVDALYDESKLALTSNGAGATIEKSYDEATAVLTITVKGDNISEDANNKHVYTIQFTVPSSELDMVATKYNGSAIAFVDGSATVDALYEEGLLNLVPVHSAASVEKSYDEETAILTVTVKAANFAKDATNKHVYTIQFKKPVSELVVPVTLNSKYAYTTICVPFDSSTPYYGTVDAWTVDGIEDNGATLVLTKIGGQLKAHQPVLLENWGLDMSEELRGFPTEGTPKAGLLTGTYEDIKAPKGSYVLQYQNETLGFYKVENTQPTVKAYHAYLNVDSNVKGFGFSTENGATAIKALEALTSGKPEIYDLNGRKLNKLQKGVNIVNGVKVLVK